MGRKSSVQMVFLLLLLLLCPANEDGKKGQSQVVTCVRGNSLSPFLLWRLMFHISEVPSGARKVDIKNLLSCQEQGERGGGGEERGGGGGGGVWSEMKRRWKGRGGGKVCAQTYCPTTNGGMQNGSSVGMRAHCIHFFACLGTDLYGQSALSNNISASELTRKFIKSALLVGCRYIVHM